MLTAALVLYAVGVIIGVVRVDAGPATRLAVSLLWPLGVVAGVVTVSALVLAAMVLFPMLGAASVTVGILIWWML